MFLQPFNILIVFGLIAIFTGFIKAGIPSLGALLSALVALAFPPRDALGVTLLFLLVGDIVAVSLYWRLAHWAELKRMILPLVIGIGAGGIMLKLLDNDKLGLTIGLMVVFLVSLEPFRVQLSQWSLQHPIKIRSVSGTLAGIATTIGNASGPILSLYFLLLKLDKKSFVGTGAIFFLFVNLIKVPIFTYQGVFKVDYLFSMAVMSPLVFIGAIVGKKFLEWIPQLWFNRVILICTALAGSVLVARYFWDKI